MKLAWLLLITLVAANYSYVLIKSDTTWKLDAYPIIREFIEKEAAKYEVIPSFAGGVPRLVFLDENFEEKKEIIVADKDIPEIVNILKEHGFSA